MYWQNRDTALQGTQLIKSEVIHKFMYLFQTGGRQLLPIMQVYLKTFLWAENSTSAAIFKAISKIAGHDIPYFLPHGKDEKLEQPLSFIHLRA